MRQDTLFFVPEAHTEVDFEVEPLGLAVLVLLVVGLVLLVRRLRRR